MKDRNISPKHRVMDNALNDTKEVQWGIDDIMNALDCYVMYGGNKEKTEYRLALACVGKAKTLMEVARDNIRELARHAHKEDVQRMKEGSENGD